MKTHNSKKIARSKRFYIGVMQYTFPENKLIREFSAEFNKKKHLASATSISYRTLNHWEEHGLIDSGRTNKKGWRKFSTVDLIWLGILDQLRSFGFSIEKMREVKKSILDDVNNPLLEIYTVMVLKLKVKAFILVFDDGIADVWTKEEVFYTEEMYWLENHVKINLHDLLMQYYEDFEWPINERISFPIEPGTTDFFANLYSGEKMEARNINGKLKYKRMPKIQVTEISKNFDAFRIMDEIKKPNRDIILRSNGQWKMYHILVHDKIAQK